MKIALLMNDNSYAGREYIDHLEIAKIAFDVIIFGKNPESDNLEDERCENLWKPKKISEVRSRLNIFRFNSLKDKDFSDHLKKNRYYVGIQGGTGILTLDVISSFSYGILNFHPGKLPEYAGCTAPEWQVYEGKEIFCTCHLIDENIDSGPIISLKVLKPSMKSYANMRATIYPQIGIFLVDIIKMFIERKEEMSPKSFPQDKKKRIYRNPISSEKLEKVKSLICKKV